MTDYQSLAASCLKTMAILSQKIFENPEKEEMDFLLNAVVSAVCIIRDLPSEKMTDAVSKAAGNHALLDQFRAEGFPKYASELLTKTRAVPVCMAFYEEASWKRMQHEWGLSGGCECKAYGYGTILAVVCATAFVATDRKNEVGQILDIIDAVMDGPMMNSNFSIRDGSTIARSAYNFIITAKSLKVSLEAALGASVFLMDEEKWKARIGLLRVLPEGHEYGSIHRIGEHGETFVPTSESNPTIH